MDVKRVDVSFKARRNRVWPGYVNPHKDKSKPCPTCKGDGMSAFARLWADKWYGKVAFNPAETGSTPFSFDHPAFQRLAHQNAEFWVRHLKAHYFTHSIYRADFFFCPKCGQHCPRLSPRQQLGFCTDHPLMETMTLAEHGELPLAAALEYEQRRLATHFNTAWQHHLDADDVQALVDANRLWEFTRKPLTPAQVEDTLPNGWLTYFNGRMPTPEEVNAWSVGGMGHDGLNQMYAVRARCKRAGQPEACSTCNGKGHLWADKAAQAEYENWKPAEPPPGEGWQLWQDQVPLTRVYKKVGWLAKHAARNLKTFADHTATEAKWREMIVADYIHHADTLTDGRTMVMRT